MEWVNKSYEKLILGLVSFIILVLSILFILKILSFKDQFVIEKVEPTHNFPETYELEVDVAQKLINSPDYIDVRKELGKIINLNVGPLMIDREGSRMYIGDKKMIHPPIPNAWFFVNDLNILDKEIKNKDSDYDGFTNLEEYKFKTSPKNSDSFPPLWVKLYFSGIEKEDYIVKFTSYNKPDIGVNRTFPKPNRSKLDLRINSRFFNDNRFLILDYTEKFGKHPGLGYKINISELKILDVVNDKEHVLTYGKKSNIPTFTAVLTFKLKETQVYKKKLGDTFYLPSDPDTVYTIEDINEKNVKLSYAIIDKETKEPIGERESFLLEKTEMLLDDNISASEEDFLELEE